MMGLQKKVGEGDGSDEGVVVACPIFFIDVSRSKNAQPDGIRSTTGITRFNWI